MKTYGAYLHCKPDGTPFYVGKGDVKRMRDLYTGRNKHHKHITKKYGNANILKGFMECSSEEIAFDLEIGLIKCLKRMGVKLANYTDGGDVGAKGYRHTEESKEKNRQAKLGKKLSEETKKKMSLAKLNKPQPNIKGRVWVTNGVETKMVYKDNIPDGFKLGRKIWL